MSAFELAAWNWHCEHVSPLTVNSGVFRDLFAELGLKDKVRVMFLKALNMIDGLWDGIATEKAKAAAAAAREAARG